MDVKVGVNGRANINLEMQVIREAGWNDRSVGYLSRLYDSLKVGTEYETAKEARQIAFCNFTLFKKNPEFYATYKLINEKPPHNVYSEKFILSNVDMTRIDLATEEDKKYHLDNWARFFTAKSWEELKMLAEKNETIEKAVSDVWQVTRDNVLREQMRAREDFILREEYKENLIKNLQEQLKQANQQHEEDAKRMHADKLPIEKIAQYVGESIETVKVWLSEPDNTANA